MSGGPDLRRGLPGDVAAIAALTTEAYAKWVPVIGCAPLPMLADYAQAIRDHRFDLLVRGEALVGLIETVGTADHLLIANVAVKPSCQGQGLGRRLMAHAEALGEAAGVGCVRLYVNKFFAANIALYESLGYRIDGEDEVDGRFRFHMSKPIGNGPGAV